MSKRGVLLNADALQHEPGLYLIRNLLSEGKYVGKTVDLQDRFREHRNQLRTGTHPNRHLQSTWSKQGGRGFRFEILQVLDEIDSDQMAALERLYIEQFHATDRRSGYNLMEAASGSMRHSAETRQKISLAARQRPPMSEEVRSRISAAGKGKQKSVKHQSRINQSLRGKKRTPEQCRRIGDAKIGFRHSEATRRSMSEKRKGKTPSGSNRAALLLAITKVWRVTSPSGEVETVRNLSAYCREHGLRQGAMVLVSQGKHHQHHGYHCEQVIDE